MSSRNRIDTVDSYRKRKRKFIESWLTGARLTIIAAISLMILFGLALIDCLQVNTFPPVFVGKSSNGGFIQIDFNMSFPEVHCKNASVDISDVFERNMLDITQTFRKYSIDSTTEEIVEDIGEGSYVLTAGNVDIISKQYPLMVVKFYVPWCIWSTRLKPTWEEAAKIITERYDPETDGRILVGEVDCTMEVDLCRRHHIRGYPTIRIVRNGSALIRMDNRRPDHDHDSYIGDRDTNSLVKMMEDLVPISLQSERPMGTKRGCRIEGSVSVEKNAGNLIASTHSTVNGAQVYIDLETSMVRKILGY